MPILGVIASSIQSEPRGTFESIATITVASDTTTTSLSFTSIPADYVRLQIRGYIRTNRADNQDALTLQFNSDTTSGNYSTHIGAGAGGSSLSTITGAANTSTAQIGSTAFTGLIMGNSPASDFFSPFTFDIWNAASSTYKAVTFLGGMQLQSQSNNRLGIVSGNWRNTSSLITSIQFASIGSQLKAGSKIALYGMKNS